jgi:hypothetical protein
MNLRAKNGGWNNLGLSRRSEEGYLLVLLNKSFLEFNLSSKEDICLVSHNQQFSVD